MMELRDATIKDKDAILAIASATWEGWDYVPLFIDDWIEEGGLLVAEMDGKIVGITKTTEISGGELWLEAIRVIPDLRKKGIGKIIAEEQLKRAKLASPKSIRLSTADVNTASRRIIAGMGFRQYAVFDFYKLSSFPQPAAVDTGKVKLLSGDGNIDQAWKTVSGSEEFLASKGLFSHTWKFSEFTKILFRILVDKGLVYVIEKEEGVAGDTGGVAESIAGRATESVTGGVTGGVTGDVTGVLIFPFNRYSPQEREIAFLDGDDASLEILGNYALGKLNFDPEHHSRAIAFAAGERKRTILNNLGLEQREDLKKVFVFDYPLG